MENKYNVAVENILKCAKRSGRRGSYSDYTHFKRQIEALGLPSPTYTRAIIRLVKTLGI